MKRYRFRTAQTALEYLITYGWGFLVILVVTGALAYYGVLNPSQYFPERCEFGSQLICEDYHISKTEIRLMLRNNFGKDIEITEARVTPCMNDALVLPAGGLVFIPVNNGDKGNITLDIQGACPNVFLFAKGNKELAAVTIKYRRATDPPGAAPEHSLNGELFARVS